MSALSYKTKNNALFIVEDFQFEAPKTKQVADALKGLALAGKKALFVVDELNENLYLSLRNISKVQSCALTDLNTYDIVNADALILTENAAKIFTEEAEEVTAE
jgi:large subunit ribosomal protein L4